MQSSSGPKVELIIGMWTGTDLRADWSTSDVAEWARVVNQAIDSVRWVTRVTRGGRWRLSRWPSAKHTSIGRRSAVEIGQNWLHYLRRVFRFSRWWCRQQTLYCRTDSVVLRARPSTQMTNGRYLVTSCNLHVCDTVVCVCLHSPLISRLNARLGKMRIWNYSLLSWQDSNIGWFLRANPRVII